MSRLLRSSSLASVIVERVLPLERLSKRSEAWKTSNYCLQACLWVARRNALRACVEVWWLIRKVKEWYRKKKRVKEALRAAARILLSLNTFSDIVLNPANSVWMVRCVKRKTIQWQTSSWMLRNLTYWVILPRHLRRVLRRKISDYKRVQVQFLIREEIIRFHLLQGMRR